MKRPRVPGVLWGVFAVNCNGAVVWIEFCSTRRYARTYAAQVRQQRRKDPVRYVVRKFVAGQRVDG